MFLKLWARTAKNTDVFFLLVRADSCVFCDFCALSDVCSSPAISARPRRPLLVPGVLCSFPEFFARPRRPPLVLGVLLLPPGVFFFVVVFLYHRPYLRRNLGVGLDEGILGVRWGVRCLGRVKWDVYKGGCERYSSVFIILIEILLLCSFQGAKEGHFILEPACQAKNFFFLFFF